MEATRRLVLPPDDAWSAPGEGAIHFVGTATVILRYAGFTLLTDPNFLHAGDHVHLGYGVRSKRLTNPAIDLAELPPIDLVVLSHLHEDHFDRLVAERLDRTVPIVTTRQAAVALRKMGFRSLHDLSTWESLQVEKGDTRLRITALPARHGPPVVSALLPAVMGSMLEFQGITVPDLRIYISGDTLVHRNLRQIPRRFPSIDVALLHLGGTRIFGVLLTMDATQGVEALRIIGPRLAIPIHYDDYTVFKSPLGDFVKEVSAAGLTAYVRCLHRGETFSFDVTQLAEWPSIPRRQ